MQAITVGIYCVQEKKDNIESATEQTQRRPL